MNFATWLEPTLWSAVSASLEARNYTTAILDTLHALSDLFRERSDLEGDGTALVGAAFGGHNPRLKINSLRTESDQNIQRGVEALLRGLYQAIRNPRSHGKHEDQEKDAVAIIVFIDYLMRIVGQSKNRFSLDAFVQQVLDESFVPKARYAELLVSRIPASKRVAICRELFNRCAEAEAEKVRFFFESVLAAMRDDEKEEFISLVSEKLTTTDDEYTIRFVLQILPDSLWRHIDEVARLRIENKLINSVRDGKWVDEISQCITGSLGTWTRNIHREITLKGDLWSVINGKLASDDEASKAYVFEFFAHIIPEAFEEPSPYLKYVMERGLRCGDVRFKRTIERWLSDQTFLNEDSADNPWVQAFQKALDSLKPGASIEDDEDIPF